MSEALPISVLLAEKLRRDEERATSTSHYQARFIELAAQCRAEFHPKQRAAFRSMAPRLAVFCTRRAGKTRGGCRETMARVLELSQQRWVYCHETKDEARKLAWRSDTRDGWRDLIEQMGLAVARSITEFNRDRDTDVLISEDDMSIDFRNGSQLIIFAADKDDAADKFRGGEKNGIWVDEAQGFGPMTYFVNDVAAKTLAKPKGKPPGVMWVSGSPHRSLSGEFFEITRDPAKHGPRRKGWEVHEFSVVDNVYFGATPQDRWDATAGLELVLNGWDPMDPPAQFIREWGTPDGKVMWTTEDTLHVFCVHQKQPAEYGPVCVDEDGAYDHKAAVKDLPGMVENPHGGLEAINWYYAWGLDFGYEDPFAYVIWAFSPQIADMFEMASWKKEHLPSDAIEDIVLGIWNTIGQGLVSIRGDSGGSMAKNTIVGWQDKLKIPIEPADKHGKDTWEDLFNGELWARRVHFRKDSVLLMELRELQYKVKAGKREIWKNRVANGVVHGDHCIDAGCRYSYRDLVSRRTEFGPVVPKTEAELDKEREQRLLKSLDVGLPGHEDDNQNGW
jgi:hypothetical protein